MADLLTSIGDLLGLNKGKATSAAAQTNQGLLSDLATQGQGTFGQINNNNQSLVDMFKPGAELYGDANGLNGPAGNARATSAFTASPGYQFAQDQGIQALERTASQRGDIGGGELPVDLAKYVTAGANNEYGDWLSRLAPYNQETASAVGNQNTGLSDLLGFNGDIASGKIAANNQDASGQEAGQGGLWTLLDNIGGVAGSVFGLNKGGVPGVGGANPPTAGFGSYGSY